MPCALRQCPARLRWVSHRSPSPPLLVCFAGTLADRVPCMEKGSRANHVTPPNDTSWSAHHPLRLKVQQRKQLPVTKPLRGSLGPTGAFDPEDSTSWTHTVCSAFLRPPLFSSKERFFLLVSCWGGFFTLVSKTTWTNIGTFPSLTSKFRYLRLDNDTDFFF